MGKRGLVPYRRRAARILKGFGAACLGIGALCLTTAALQSLVANGDTRTLSFAHIHIDDTLTVTFKRNGRYDPEALKKLNWYLRDWRRDKSTEMDPHLFDLLWEIHREVGGTGPITIISAYRSPETNTMLRARSRGVAEHSQHMVGKAIDFYIPGSELADLRAIGLRLQRGGVGFYPTSGSPFVHIDIGGVRHWPRMTRDQLAKLFPDGKTVHIPADGKPMPGFQLALAEIEGRGGQAGSVAQALRGENPPDEEEVFVGDGGRMKRFIASLFGSVEEPGDEQLAAPRSNRTRIPTQTVLTSAGETAREPQPVARPLALASAPAAPAKIVTPSRAAPIELASLGPTPLPQKRPSDLGSALPPEITGTASSGAGNALAYAAEPSRPLPNFGPIPSNHDRIVAEPERPFLPTPAPLPAPAPLLASGEADAARAPELLLSAYTLESNRDLHHPDLNDLAELVLPARAALRTRFDRHPMGAPGTFRFAGPAVVALEIISFERNASLGAARLARFY